MRLPCHLVVKQARSRVQPSRAPILRANLRHPSREMPGYDEYCTQAGIDGFEALLTDDFPTSPTINASPERQDDRAGETGIS